MLAFDPLDEYPIHQVPLPMRYVAMSDRNFYDRCIYQGVDHEAETYFITGLGAYANLGVMDAYATVRRGDKQWAVRMSGSRPTDKLSQQVGPYRIEVVQPYHELRIICDADDYGLGFDLTYRSEYGPICWLILSSGREPDVRIAHCRLPRRTVAYASITPRFGYTPMPVMKYASAL